MFIRANCGISYSIIKDWFVGLQKYYLKYTLKIINVAAFNLIK